MSRAEFARLALERIKQVRPDVTADLDEAQFHIMTKGPDGESSLASLGNFYEEYLHAPPERRSSVLDRVTKMVGLLDTKEGLDEVRVMLMPRIRPRRYFDIDSVQAAAALPEAKAVHCYYRPFAGHLGIAIAVDRPEHIEYVMDPTKYGVPISELEEIALVNLKRAKTSALVEYAPGLFVGSWNDDYAVERMLLPDLFADLGLKGDPVVFLPGAERIYVVGSEDENALVRAFALAVQRADEPRGLVAFPFVRVGGTWKAFVPTGRLGPEIGRQLALYLAGVYASQKEALEASLAETTEDPPFVASVMAMGDEQGHIEATVATWTDGVHTLLPRTTHIAFITMDMPSVGIKPPLVPWEDVMEIAGTLVEERTDLYPPRYEVKAFPDPTMLARLAAPASAPSSARHAPERAPLRRPFGAYVLAALLVLALIYRFITVH